ncbi:hypothetical protein KQH99_03480 [Clostridium cochlearium]|nr:hypothetical protein [Clostridium cochlearium]
MLGGTMRSYILTPPHGIPLVDCTYSNKTLGFGGGHKAVLAGDTKEEIAGFPGGLVFNQISAFIVLEEKLEIVNTLTNKSLPEFLGFTKAAHALLPLPIMEFFL